MPRKHFRKYLPDHETVREHRHLRWAQPLLKYPNLWHLNRRSVAGGVAAGMIGGLIPGPIQMLTAAILAIVFRVNIPVAVATTLLTNPITWPFFIIAAYTLGGWVTGDTGATLPALDFDWQAQGWANFLPQFWQWLLSLGETYLIGNTILATALALLGYAAVLVGWRLYLLAYLRKRAKRRLK